MSRRKWRKAARPEKECESCPLPDCNPKDPGCPLAGQADQRSVQEGHQPASRFAPSSYKGRRDYLRQYARNCRLVALKGVKIPRVDLEFLEKACRQQGRTLPEIVRETLEAMVKSARDQSIQVKAGKPGQ